MTRTLLLQLAVLLTVSIGFESIFIRRGINVMDEGWPLYAAMELQAGKTLYDEVFWVFPPGHLLPAWIAYAWDPPGLVGARMLYAAFAVCLCIGLYLLARRLMPPDFALLAGLMVAVAAPGSHQKQLLFGYRYLIFSVIVLLLFQRRLSSGKSRWLIAAGVFTGIALFFRLTPAAAVAVAVGVAVMAADRDWRRWVRDWLFFAAGVLIVLIPVLVTFQSSVGLEKLWLEVVVRPVEMTALQSEPLPDLVFEGWDRRQVGRTFTAFGFRLYPLLYAGLTLTLLLQWFKAYRERRSFDNVLLLAVVLWGGVFFFRSLGRSDEPHLDSVIPPVALVIAYLVSLAGRLSWLHQGSWRASLARAALCAAVLTLWAYLFGVHHYVVRPDDIMGATPLASVGQEVTVRRHGRARMLDVKIPMILEHSNPADTVLVMTNAPLLYVLADRHGPGYHDLVMPGTFRSEQEERRFLERLKADPPAVVVLPQYHFDRMESRGLRVTAPKLRAWVQRNYRQIGDRRRFVIMVPAGTAPR